jgi:hypothetical protein
MVIKLKVERQTKCTVCIGEKRKEKKKERKKKGTEISYLKPLRMVCYDLAQNDTIIIMNCTHWFLKSGS